MCPRAELHLLNTTPVSRRGFPPSPQRSSSQLTFLTCTVVFSQTLIKFPMGVQQPVSKFFHSQDFEPSEGTPTSPGTWCLPWNSPKVPSEDPSVASTSPLRYHPPHRGVWAFSIPVLAFVSFSAHPTPAGGPVRVCAHVRAHMCGVCITCTHTWRAEVSIQLLLQLLSTTFLRIYFYYI